MEIASQAPLQTGEAAFDFANILFSGRCSARCPFCIGQQIDPRLHRDNLDDYPPRGLERFIELVQRFCIPQVVLTGSNTDPQLYRHEARLLDCLRQALPAGTQISLHTNGRLALRKLDLLRRYDRLCISFPAFDPGVYRQIMDVPDPPDLERIVALAGIPVKVSCVLTRHNLPGMPAYLERLQQIGVQRLVLRQVYQESGAANPDWDISIDPSALRLRQVGAYRGNPVFEYNQMASGSQNPLQVTLWDFAGSASRSINLFSSGAISQEYLLVKAPPL